MEQVNYIFFYYCYIDDKKDLIFMKKEKHNLTVNNLLTSDDLINIIYRGKKKYTNKSKVFSIVVHNNYDDPLSYLQKNDLPQYAYETNGLKDITFQNTHKEFSKLNSVYIFYQHMTTYINDSQVTTHNTENMHDQNKTKKVYISLKNSKKNTRKSIPLYASKLD